MPRCGGESVLVTEKAASVAIGRGQDGRLAAAREVGLPAGRRGPATPRRSLPHDEDGRARARRRYPGPDVIP